MAVGNLSLDYHIILPVMGNPLVGDRVGLGVALIMVLASLRQGKFAAYPYERPRLDMQTLTTRGRSSPARLW